MVIDGFSTKPRRRGRTAASLIGAAFCGALAVSSSCAQDSTQGDSPFRALMKGAGLATDIAPPPDFVQSSRSAEEPASIPAFTTPAEPPGKIKTAKELEDVDSDLEATAKRHDALRAAYPPSAKAMKQAEAAKKAKTKDKQNANSVLPRF